MPGLRSTSAPRAPPGSASTRSPPPASGTSRDEREAALLRYLKPLAEQHGTHPAHLHEEAREAGWSDEQLLEAIALVSMESFTAMINLAGEIPVDGSVEETRVLRAA